jgi:hypothetical protein
MYTSGSTNQSSKYLIPSISAPVEFYLTVFVLVIRLSSICSLKTPFVSFMFMIRKFPRPLHMTSKHNQIFVKNSVIKMHVYKTQSSMIFIHFHSLSSFVLTVFFLSLCPLLQKNLLLLRVPRGNKPLRSSPP